MNISTEIRKLMLAHGFILARTNHHLVWHHPRGPVVVTSKTPSGNPIDKIKADIRRQFAIHGIEQCTR